MSATEIELSIDEVSKLDSIIEEYLKASSGIENKPNKYTTKQEGNISNRV